MATILKPPAAFPELVEMTSVFLGGSIENGKAVDWQKRAEEFFAPYAIYILNPRRDDWDTKLDLDPTPGTSFHEQVTWELEAQDRASFIIYNFVPDTISPITLLELGLYAKSNKLYVSCPPEYFRYGNVKLVCDKYHVPFFENFEDLLKHIAS